MFIGYFTERPYQDFESGWVGATGREIEDLGMTNGDYDPRIGAELYNRYLDEKVYAEEMGFDGLMLNEHHSTPFCMGGVMNVEAAILARITKRAKIVLLGNVLPIWGRPALAGRGTGRDRHDLARSPGHRLGARHRPRVGRSQLAGAVSTGNASRRPHDFVVKGLVDPRPLPLGGRALPVPLRQPWARPYQDPHPQIWIPGVMSRNTVKWCAEHRYPYVMLATEIEPTKKSFEYYDEVAQENGYEASTEHHGYLFKVHVDETEELAEEAGRKYISGPANPFLEGNQGTVRSNLQNLPGLTSRTQLLPTVSTFAAAARGRQAEQQAALAEKEAEQDKRDADAFGTYEEQVNKYSIITGTPKTVIPKIRHVLEELRPGNIFFWDGDGAMNHDDAMRSLPPVRARK